MKALKKIGMHVAMYLLALSAGLGVAHAGQVTVKFKVFPSGSTFDKNIISAGCESAKADNFADGADEYTFLFWDNQGEIQWTNTAEICVGSGDTNATAWYEITGGGGGGCPETGCFIQTYAYSIDHDEFLKGSAKDDYLNGTPIALVSPNSPEVWPGVAGPGANPDWQLVNTEDGTEDVSAFSALAFPKHKPEPFRYWQTVPYIPGSPDTPETPPGIVYDASLNDTSIVVAFYGPDPCAALEQELEACLASGDGPHGKLNCTALGHEVQLCQKENRETNASPALASLLKGVEK
jgi:hypothetical protein